MNSTTVKRLVGWAVLALALSSVATWYFTRDTLPNEIRIATSAETSYYFEIGESLARHLERATGKRVRAVVTEGSVENVRKLGDGEVQLAIVEASVLPAEGIAVVCPLYSEVVHLIVRRDSGIGDVTELAGTRVLVGDDGSAMRRDAAAVLDHYRVSLDTIDVIEGPAESMLEDPEIQATIVTTGLLSPMLRPFWERGEFEVLPIVDAKALSLVHSHFIPSEIPRGLYGEQPPVPSVDTPSIATTAVLVANDDASKLLVHEVLSVLYETDFALEFSTLVSASEAEAWPLMPLHPLSRSYFQPYEGIDLLASFMESLAATKELLFALAAAFYLALNAWRSMKEKESAVELQALKDRLDTFLDETIRIERAQMETEDRETLEAYLNEVTEIKLRALEELSHEDLRGDGVFLIFLTQCANLIRKIQTKIELSQT